jgi:nicotinamidase-related amidase
MRGACGCAPLAALQRGVVRARGNPDKALAVAGVKSIAVPLSPGRCQQAFAGYHLSMTDTAVLVIDMMNTYRHPGAAELVPNVEKIIEPPTDLVRRARESDGVDLVYVNDNRGDFTAQLCDLVRSACDGARPDLVKPITPAEGDRMITKVRHSAFYSTPVAYLLNRLGTKRLILTGQVTEQCILYSALDAYVRHFQVVVPTDAVAHIDPDLGAAALKMMQQNMSAELTTAADCLN